MPKTVYKYILNIYDLWKNVENVINKVCKQIIYILYNIYVLAGFGIKQPTMVDMP